MPSAHIFASKLDWASVAQILRDEYDFYRTEHTQVSTSKKYSFDEINLGISKAASQVQGGTYLIVRRGFDLAPRKIKESLYAWDPMLNQHAIVVSFGGAYEDSWIAGTVGYKVSNENAKDSYQDWMRAIKKSCRLKIQAYYLGEECAEFFEKDIYRFTTDNNSPKEYDLKK